MIQKLFMKMDGSRRYDDSFVVSPPSNEELMNKVNEIIEYVNSLEKPSKNPFLTSK
jgi:hypothetical protein